MDWERIKAQLESILQANVCLVKFPAEEWNRAASSVGIPVKGVRSVEVDHQVLFFLEAAGASVQVLAVDEALLTGSERKLVEIVLDGQRLPERGKLHLAGEEERKARLVKDWFYQQLETGDLHAEMPDSLAAQLSLHTPRIPILLYGDYSDARGVHYGDLKKLLESFFDADIVLIPLMEKEWLVLGSEALLEASGEGEKDATSEGLEEALVSIGSGLNEMLGSEWVGECHVAVHEPIQPSRSLIRAILQLRETIALGKSFHPGVNVHFPWTLHLEKLVSSVPETEKNAFVSRVLKRTDILDDETVSTLESFFSLDCSVSETAKKLYIHRNTLLYRLDKFKQETGLDVRSFNDAVLVKTALLLYKVTKRK